MLVTPRGLRFKREHTKRNSKLKSLKMKHNDDTHDRGKDTTFFGYILLAYMMKK